MPYDTYALIEGVEGSATRQGFEGQVAIESVSWGAENMTSMGAGTGKGAGKASVHPMVFTKLSDAASTDLFQACVSGTHIPTIEVTFNRAGGEEAVDYLKFVLGGCFISSFQLNGSSGGGDQPTETFVVESDTVEMTYTPQSDTGAKQGPKVASWDSKLVAK